MHLKEPIAEILTRLGIASLNTMQQSSVAAIVAHKEVLLLSPTGTGKTLGFLLPLFQLLKKNKQKVQALVLSPSRELALQTAQVWKQMATGYKASCCYGGHDMQLEIQEMVEAPALLIGTPGRIADHIRRNTFDADTLQIIVFDEFDKSLALGFEEEMSFIVSSLTGVERKIFVSATESIAIPAFAGVGDGLFTVNHLHESVSESALTYCRVISKDKDKLNRLFELLCYIRTESVLIFCNHREAVERTAAFLKEKGIECGAFHGGMEQMQREQTLIRFRNGSVRFLVATDLAARGLDIPEIKHVVHYHLPATEAEFTHRNGRTARMQASGTVYLLLHSEEPLLAYLKEQPEELQIPVKLSLPAPAEWVTLFINGGKKDKLNKVDLVGFLMQKGRLAKEELGLIIVKDHVSFVAIRKHKSKTLLALVQEEKIKGKKYRIAVAR